MTFTYGSLCTGVAVLDLAVEQAFGAEPAWFAEIDKDACRLLARHFPDVPNLGDIHGRGLVRGRARGPDLRWSAVPAGERGRESKGRG